MVGGTLWRGDHWQLLREREPEARLVLLARSPDALTVTRVRRAAEDMRGLSHDALLRLTGIIEEWDRVGLTFEDPGGETLEQRLAAGPLASTVALELVERIGGALSAMHSTGIAHGSVSSDLILISPRGAMLCPGDSSAADSDAHLSRQGVHGSAPSPYTAPEQFVNPQPTPATDAWALGIVLHRSVIGRYPVASRDRLEFEAQVRRGLPPMPTLGQSFIPEIYEGLVRTSARLRWTCATASERAHEALSEPQAAGPTEAVTRVSVQPAPSPYVTRAPTSPQAARATDASSVPLVLGNFEIRQLRGRGASAAVYEAWDRNLGRTVALKMLGEGERETTYQVSEWRARFDRERQVQARLDAHPNIVRVHHAGEDNGRPVLVLEYMEGSNLAEWASEGRPSAYDIARVGRQVASALAYAHARSIVHRDVKPQNVLLDASRHSAKLMDFGIAQVSTDAQHTRALGGPHPGTPAYMSPEQEVGRAYLDARSDIYSLGCTIYEFATGRVYKTERIPLRLMRPDLPSELSKIVDRCLEVAPSDRYQRAELVSQDFARFESAPSRTAVLATIAGRAQSAISRFVLWPEVHLGLRWLAARITDFGIERRTVGVVGAVVVLLLASGIGLGSEPGQLFLASFGRAPAASPTLSVTGPTILPTSAAPTLVSRPPTSAPVGSVAPAVPALSPSQTVSASPSSTPIPFVAPPPPPPTQAPVATPDAPLTDSVFPPSGGGGTTFTLTFVSLPPGAVLTSTVERPNGPSTSTPQGFVPDSGIAVIYYPTSAAYPAGTYALTLKATIAGGLQTGVTRRLTFIITK